MQDTLIRLARACRDAAGQMSGSTGSDCSGVETNGHGVDMEGAKAGKRQRAYL